MSPPSCTRATLEVAFPNNNSLAPTELLRRLLYTYKELLSTAILVLVGPRDQLVVGWYLLFLGHLHIWLKGVVQLDSKNNRGFRLSNRVLSQLHEKVVSNTRLRWGV